MCHYIFNGINLTFKSFNGSICVSSNSTYVGIYATNNLIKLKDSDWFNEEVYTLENKGNKTVTSGANKTDFYNSSTEGAVKVKRRTWPSN